MTKVVARYSFLRETIHDFPPMPFAAPVAHSKGRINRAGVAVREEFETDDDLDVINDWRASHAYILNTFQAMHRNRTRQTTIVVAQRLKRLWTIMDKLARQPRMELARMDDVAGCRIIFQSVAELYAYRDAFLKARVGHKRRNEDDKYDYIKNPKPDGYRGIHDIYEYNVNSKLGKKYNGLLLELQYRTTYQHAWATSVEVVGLITANQPKFNAGDERYKEFFRLTSEIIARVYEESTACYPKMSDGELIGRFYIMENDINLLRTLKGINAANEEILASKNVILVFSEENPLEILSFRRPGEAISYYFDLEKQAAEDPKNTKDIVLVRADTGEDIRTAFKNYFSDTVDFVQYVEDGIEVLGKRHDEKAALS